MVPNKALRGAGFGPQPAGACSPRAPACWIFVFVAGRCGLRARFLYLLRGGAGCGLDQCGAGRAAIQDMSKYAGRAAGSNFQPAQGLSP